MALAREEVRHIATLARIELREEEVEKFRDQLSSILDYVKKLQEVETSSVDATFYATDLVNVFRKDEVKEYMESERLLEEAPERDGQFFKVKVILK